MDKDFEQYKMAIETADKTTDRRYNFNKFITAILTAILSALGVISSRGVSILLFPLCFGGGLISFIWIKQIDYFKKMVKIKYTTIKNMEEKFNLYKTYTLEDKLRDEYKEDGEFQSFSEQEKYIAWSFLACFTLYLMGIIMYNVLEIKHIIFK